MKKTKHRRSNKRNTKRKNRRSSRQMRSGRHMLGGVSRNPSIQISPFQQFKIDMMNAIMDGNRVVLQNLIQNNLQFMNPYWVYCCRDFLVDTLNPEFMQSDEYARWRNQIQSLGIPLEPVYEIDNPLLVLKILLDVEPIPGIAVGNGLFRYPPAINRRHLFNGIIIYMRDRNIIDRDLIRKLNHKVAHVVLDCFENSIVLTPDIAYAFIEEAINADITQMGNEMHLSNLIITSVENRLLPELDNRLIEQMLRLPDTFLHSIIQTAIRRVVSYNHFIMFYRALVQGRPAHNQWLHSAIFYRRIDIARFLIDNGAIPTQPSMRLLLERTPELLEYALTHGATLPPDALSIVPANYRHIVESWPHMMASYSLDQANQLASSYGLDGFSDYLDNNL